MTTEPHHGRHELPPKRSVSEIGDTVATGVTGGVSPGRSQVVFRVLAVLLCLLLGVAIATQVRQTRSGDSLEAARPAELLVLLDSLHQREAALNTEVAELQRTLTQLKASGSSDQTAIENARARLAALSVMIGTVAATGPGVTLTIEDPTQGVSPETMLDVINELRAAGAEAMEIRGLRTGEQVAVRVGVDTWIVGSPGALVVDSATLNPAYSVLAIGDPPTLAAAMNIPGGAMDSIERVGGTMVVQQSDRVDINALRQPKPRQYAQPVKSARDTRSAVSDIPAELSYTAEHEWVQRTGDDTVRVGITEFAQSALGDVVFVQLPEVGADVVAGESFGEVESTKSVSDLYAPVSAKVLAVNGDLDGDPQLVNSDPYGAGWLVELQAESGALEACLRDLLDADGYRSHVAD